MKVAQQWHREIDFSDKAIHKLYIKSGPRKDFKFRNIKVSYLKGLHLRYSPLTQMRGSKLIEYLQNFQKHCYPSSHIKIMLL